MVRKKEKTGERKMKQRKKAFYENVTLLRVLFIAILVLVIAIAILAIQLVFGGKNSKSASASKSSSSQITSESQSTAENQAAAESQVSSVQEATVTPTAKSQQETQMSNEQVDLTEDSLQSLYGYMVNVSEGSVILEKNADQIMYPASMTKVMTVLLALEYLPNRDEMLTVTADTDSLNAEGASMAGFVNGETVTVRELLYGAMLPSGADACITLAERISGSEEAFVELMNQKAEELGMSSTHFTNCTGLHNENHYSSCRDMEKLFETAIQDENFQIIVGTKEYDCSPNEYHEEGLHFESTMFSLLDSSTLSNGAEILGGKTGTTDEAGYCLVSYAKYQGDIYILVTAMGQYNEEGTHVNIEDAVTAYSAL